MKCYICESELGWCSDHTFEDHCMDGSGIVTTLECGNDKCDVTIVRVFREDKDDE